MFGYGPDSVRVELVVRKSGPAVDPGEIADTANSGTGAKPTRSPLPSFVSASVSNVYQTEYFNEQIHKAFVVATDGSYGTGYEYDTIRVAINGAFSRCEKHSTSCALYDVDGIAFDGWSKSKSVASIGEIERLVSDGMIAVVPPENINPVATGMARLSAKRLCNTALAGPNENKRWETTPRLQSHVNEAKSRGFSVADCMRHAGIVTTSATPVPPTTTETAPPADPSSIEERLTKLKKLHDSGLIDEDSYKKKVDALLQQL